MKRLWLILFLALVAWPLHGQVIRTENTGIDVVGQFRCSGDISPAQITLDQNDYNPTGLANSCVLRLNSDAARNITGLAGGADGRWVVIHNTGAQNIVLVSESVSSTAANRFTLNANITLAGTHAVLLYYDSTSSRWRAIASSIEGAAGGGAPTSASYIVVTLDGTLTADRNLVAGAGLGSTDGGANAAFTLATLSSEADFLASGALTCGAATQGKVQVHTTPLQYCDNAATPALQYAAYGNSSGDSTAAANDSVALTTDTTGNYAADVSAGAGLTKSSSAGEGQTVDLSVLSTEAAFLTDGGVTSLTCGAANQGKMHVMDDGRVEACDGAATSVLRTIVSRDTTDTLTNKTLAAAANVIDADTAVALAANGGNCSAGSYPLGVDAAGASETCTDYGTETKTFTNKTLDVEGTGNAFTDIVRLEFPFALCIGATASQNWDDSPLSTEGAAACIAGTNKTRGVMDLDAAADEGFGQIEFQLPTGWTGNIDVEISWLAAATTGNVDLNIQTGCTATGETMDAALNAAQSVVDAAQGTTNQLNVATQTAVTTTGCTAGERFTLYVFRDADDATNDTMTGDLRGVSAVVTYRVTK